jgi:hypothetical protein
MLKALFVLAILAFIIVIVIVLSKAGDDNA